MCEARVKKLSAPFGLVDTDLDERRGRDVHDARRKPGRPDRFIGSRLALALAYPYVPTANFDMEFALLIEVVEA